MDKENQELTHKEQKELSREDKIKIFNERCSPSLNETFTMRDDKIQELVGYGYPTTAKLPTTNIKSVGESVAEEVGPIIEKGYKTSWWVKAGTIASVIAAISGIFLLFRQ